MRAFLLTLPGLVLFAAALSCDGGGNNMTTPSQCSDGADNDGDGTVDFPDDLGCVSETDETEDSPISAKCQDGRDNDGDMLTDYPGDPGCFAPQADDETDDCPTGPNCPQCADDMDNDGNGSIDYPNDPGCTSAGDDDEYLHNPVACGAGLMIAPLPTTGIVEGMLDSTSTSSLTSGCGGGGGAPARAYELHLSKPKVVEISTDDPLTTADTIVAIRTDMCSAANSELDCSDDIDNSNTNSKVTISLQAGNYYVIVAGVDAAATGSFKLQVKQFNGEGTTCANQGDCGPGLVCRVPLGQTGMVCSQPMCNDGVDDDGDGDGNDYPDDPGCTSPQDNDEEDMCPSGPGCPECGDNVDNDGDNMTDYPNDPTCQAKGDASEACVSSEGVQLITGPMTMGDTTMATNDFKPTCSSSSTSGPDRTYRLNLPALTSLDLNLVVASGYDTASAFLTSTCAAPAVACSDPTNMHLNAVAAGTYYFIVDGYFSDDSGPFTINVSGKIANNGDCSGQLATSGALTCGAGYACKPAGGGAMTCQPALCSDGISNNDGDSLIDYPEDPGCDSPADDTEADPPVPPVCANGVTDDADADVDWPMDYGCVAASGTSEVFCAAELDMTSLASTSTSTGTTAGLANHIVPTCRSTSTAPDRVYALSLPVSVDTLVIDTIGSMYDSVLHVRDAACGTEFACDDDAGGSLTSKVTMLNVAAGNYAIVVDGYSSSAGMYTLNIKGTVASGTRCSSPLFSGGAAAILQCPMGTTCQGGGANARCMP